MIHQRDQSPEEAPEGHQDTNQPLGMGDSEIELFVRDLQVEALLRAAVFFEEQRAGDVYTLRDLIDLLADAEREAQFVCGFIGLAEEQDLAQITQAVELMRERGYCTIENGNISLTEVGRRKSSEVSLPQQIEEHFG